MKSLVLLSAGLDSTVSLAHAVEETDVKLVLCFDYGQRAAVQECDRADDIAASYKLDFGVVKLPWFYDITKTALINTEKAIPKITQKQLEINDPKLKDSARSVWVPNRNGVFLNIAAAYAESMGLDLVVTGFNAEEAQHFPDNSEEFMIAANDALKFSTLNGVKVGSYVSQLAKADIMRWARKLDIPIDLVWPCYDGADDICQKCEGCQRFIRALSDTESHDWYTEKSGVELPRPAPKTDQDAADAEAEHESAEAAQ